VGWTSTDLITRVKRRGVIPVAQATWLDADFLETADDEILSYLVPLVRRVREDYYLQETDFTVSDGAEYRLPYRAAGAALRDLQLITSGGDVKHPPRITIDELDDEAVGAWGAYFFGGVIRLLEVEASDYPTLRMVYYLRPSALVAPSAVGVVQSFNATAKTITLVAAPAAFTGITSWDVVRAKPGFDMLAFDKAGTIVGTTITFSTALPADLAVGDYVCLPEQTPVPQIPAEFFSLLVERMVFRFAQGQGDTEAAQLAASVATRLEADATSLIQQRLGPMHTKIMPVRGLWGR
jgi:hypothetical protein